MEDHFPFHGQSWKALSFASALSQPGRDVDRATYFVAGDGTPANVFSSESRARPYIQLFKWDGERYVGPKILAYHLGKAEQFRLFRARSTTSAHEACDALPRTQRAMRFTPDGMAVLYTSDLTAYSNMYLVELGEFDELPDLE